MSLAQEPLGSDAQDIPRGAPDLGITFWPAIEREKAVRAKFVQDTAQHALTIAQDEGTYRHLRVRQPDSSSYWYEIVTWPGALMIRGDMGSFAFSRHPDMFTFFRSAEGYVNARYWAEKVIAQSGDDAESARRAMSEFWHDEHQFSDVWETDLTDYTHRFLWCLHAIVHAIASYDAAKAAPTETTTPPPKES